MSKYTTQVRWIVESNTMEHDMLPISQRIDLALPKIFNFQYPIWNVDYKPILERKIIMHYFNKEVGLETVGLWKLYLEERLNLIMPLYNKMYETTVKDYDYLSNNNYEEVYTGVKAEKETAEYKANINATLDNEVDDDFTGNGTTDENGTNTRVKKELKSDLPQANYANLDYGTDLVNTDESDTRIDKTSTQNTSHQSNIQRSDSTTDQASNNDIDRHVDDSYTRTRKGASNYPITDLLMKYRDSLINIDRMIIEDLKDLFMMIY